MICKYHTQSSFLLDGKLITRLKTIDSSSTVMITCLRGMVWVNRAEEERKRKI